MWTAIWTLLAFMLLLFHGDAILAFGGEQLDQRRAHRLAIERERTKQTLVAQQRDALVWRQLNGANPQQDAPDDHAQDAQRLSAAPPQPQTGIPG
jgi:hypothetical protein